MIKVDIITAIAAWLTLSISFLFLLWVSARSKDTPVLENFGENYQCPFCTYIFMDYAEKKILKCPRCKSLITRKEDTKKQAMEERAPSEQTTQDLK